MKKLIKRIKNWGYKSDPEGITNFDAMTMVTILVVGLSLWIALMMWALNHPTPHTNVCHCGCKNIVIENNK
jgi:hypothetical protein